MSKKIDFLRSIGEMSEVDLKSRIQEDELRLKKLSFAHAVSPLENPMNIRGVRRDIARLKTALKSKLAETVETVETKAETVETKA